ncbi:MAG: DUF6777 domain-containing protein [Actinomycetota bacterium]
MGPPPSMMPLPPSGPPPVARHNTTLIVGALIVVIALVGIGLVIAKSGDDSTGGAKDTGLVTTIGGPTVDPSTLGPGEVLLEPVNKATVDPFTDNERLGTETQPTVSLPAIPIPSTTATLAPGQVPLPQVSGAEPGLYGGTRNEQVCDKEKMIAFLESHADKAAAWAGVQGISVADIRAYISGLTPMILTRDTRVTNHGFKNGKAYAHPSVLQAGSAVMVDKYGVPRAKCSCGNPLTPPEPLTQGPTYVGPQWPGFSPTTIIVVIQSGAVVGGFTIVDLSNGSFIVRPVGANADTPDLATGDIRVTLSWKDAGDLDLAVKDPSGEIVDYDTKKSASGGRLDVDANSTCSEALSQPAENIIWPKTGPKGRYVVQVTMYGDCGSPGEHPFLLQVFIGGVRVDVQALSTSNNAVTPSDGTGKLSTSAPSKYFVFTRS